MGTISQKLEYLNTTKGKIKDSINITGANIGANDTFRSYSTKLKDGIVDMINNGTDTAYNNFPKATGTGSDITLNDTYNSKLKVDLKGNTYQKSYSGKNLFDYTTTVFQPNDYVTIQTSNNTITITTKASYTSGNLFFRTKIPDEYLENGKTYTISSVNISGVKKSLKLQLRNKNGSYASLPMDYSITYDNNYSLYVVENIFATESSTVVPSGTVAVIKNVQVEQGSTATSYEPYTNGASPNPDYPQNIEVVTGYNEVKIEDEDGTNSQSYEINLGKNLFDKSNMTWIRNNDGDYHNTANNNTTRIRTQNLLKLEGGKTYTISGIPSGISVNAIKFYANTSSTSAYSYVTTATFSVPTEASYVIFQFGGTDFTDATNTLMANADIQLEQGTQATSYSAYKTPIELCKIGEYQDYIYKENDKWYKYSEIKKIVFNGSEDWSTQGRSYSLLKTVFTNGDLPRDTLLMICNNFSIVVGSNDRQGAIYVGGSYVNFNYDNTGNDLNGYKTWLGTHNTEVYYVLSTPTVTILDDELQNQLNELESANSYLGQTNITAEYISGNQPFNMSVSALLKE